MTVVEGRIVDVVAGSLTEPRRVVLEGGRIAAIEPIAIGAPVPDRFFCPGLIDAHVHLTFGAGPDPIGAYRALDDDGRRHVALANAAIAVRAGITTVRDLGAPLDTIADVARAITAGEAPGPDVAFAGAAITRPGGHIGLFGGEVADAPEARAMVERQLAAGARAIKLVVSGGGLTPGTRPDRAELPAEVIAAAVEVARAAGLPVAAHCHATEAIRRATDAGVDTIEHVSFVGDDGRVAVDRDLATRMRDAGMAAVPTLSGSLRSAARYRIAGAAHNPDEVDAIARLESRRWVTAALRDLGVTIVAGSDAGVTDTPLDSLHDDLAAFVEAGMTPAEALRSATSDAARHLGLGDRGVIEVGRRADILVLDRDPLVDITALRAPLAVIAAGRSLPAAG